MLSFKSMAKAAKRRRDVVNAKIEATRDSLKALEEELESIDRVLGALAGEGRRPAGRPRGKWRPGRPGRPPKWYVDQQKGKARGKGRKPAKKRRKRVSPKVLAGLARARKVLAAKRAAAAKTAT